MTTRTITVEALAAALMAVEARHRYTDDAAGPQGRIELRLHGTDTDADWLAGELLRYLPALPAEPAGAGLREALERAKQHRECGRPTYDGCYSHFTGPHCRADGLPWPCDVENIRAAIAATPKGLRWENWRDPFPPAALDVERLARALGRFDVTAYNVDPLGIVLDQYEAARDIAAAYEEEK